MSDLADAVKRQMDIRDGERNKIQDIIEKAFDRDYLLSLLTQDEYDSVMDFEKVLSANDGPNGLDTFYVNAMTLSETPYDQVLGMDPKDIKFKLPLSGSINSPGFKFTVMSFRELEAKSPLARVKNRLDSINQILVDDIIDEVISRLEEL